jgi:cell division protein FtsN
VLIGLIVGAVLAVGVALWVTGSNPYTPAAPAPLRSRSARPPAAPAAPDTAPSFDFYKVLPSDARANCRRPPRRAAPAPRYYLQAGAFRTRPTPTT